MGNFLFDALQDDLAARLSNIVQGNSFKSIFEPVSQPVLEQVL